MNNKILDKIKSEIRYGDIKTIADKIGISKQCVSQHLSGRYKKVSPIIIETALIVITERKAYEKNVLRRVEKIIQN